MNKDKSIKDLKELNDKLKNQLEYSKIRVYHLEMELKKHDNNWNELKKFVENELNHNVDKEKSFMGYQCKIILDKIEELENDN